MGKKIVTCGIYIFRSDNRFLIGHPTKHKEHIWSIPKGRIDDGETDLFEVAKRELEEEANIKLDNYKIERKKEFDTIKFKNGKYLKAYFIKIDSDLNDVDIKCNSMVYRKVNGVDLPVFPEFDDFKWVTTEEAKQYLREFQHDQLDKCEKYLTENIYKFKFLRKFIESRDN
jgi:predicted NUDIX family NTP pyrophosphohydrolase